MLTAQVEESAQRWFTRHTAAVVAPVVLIGTMYPIFLVLDAEGDRWEDVSSLAFLARRTDSMWWPAAAHVLGGS